MKKKQIKFILLLCVCAVVIWAVGEVLIGLVWDLGLTFSRIWAVLMLIATFAVSLWKCPK